MSKGYSTLSFARGSTARSWELEDDLSCVAMHLSIFSSSWGSVAACTLTMKVC